MSKTDDAPYELFKQALMTTAKAMSAEQEVEVTFSGDGSRAEGKRITLPPPPREMSPTMAARARGEADAAALRLAHHDALAHAEARPDGEVGRQVYEAAERARIESLGARAMDGTANNLDAALIARSEKAGYTRVTDRKEAPIAPAVELLLRERLTGRPVPEPLETFVDLWRGEVGTDGVRALDGMIAELEDQLVRELDDQAAFAETVQRIIRDYTAGDEAGQDDGQEDEDAPEDADDNNQQNSSDDGEAGEETQGATMEEMEAGDAVATFTSSMGPITAGDATTGDATEMFTSSMAPVTSDAETGNAVELFTSSMGPVTAASTSHGDAVEAFTSSMAPVSRGDTDAGDGCEIFTSSM